jgi:hypothetical protein
MKLYLQSLGKPFIKNVKSIPAVCDLGFTRINRRFTELNGGSVTGLIAAGSKQQELLHTMKKRIVTTVLAFTTLSAF